MFVFIALSFIQITILLIKQIIVPSKLKKKQINKIINRRNIFLLLEFNSLEIFMNINFSYHIKKMVLKMVFKMAWRNIYLRIFTNSHALSNGNTKSWAF